MKYIMSDSYPAALDALCDKLKKRKFDIDEYHVVLTPDRYTLAVETKLFSEGGAIDCEVLTLSRLTHRVVEESKMLPCPDGETPKKSGKTLSREAGVMLTARAIASVDLSYYGNASKYGDFAREVYETLLQIESSSAGDIRQLEAVGTTKQKLDDLADIKAAYETLKGDYSDSPDRLKELIDLAKTSELVKTSRFYAIGYNNATKLNRDVFDALAKAAKSFEFYDANPPAPRESFTLYKAPDPISQYKAVAAEIKNYIYTGGGAARYGDVSIICPEPRALMRILNEYGIPFYSDTQAALFDTPPLALLYSLYQMKKGGRADTKNVVAIAKNPYSRCADEDAERLEYELEKRGAYDAESADIKDASACRALDSVKSTLDMFCKQQKFVDVCRAVIEKLEFEKTFEKISGDETDAVRPILNLLELVERFGAGTFDGDAQAFFSAARASAVKSLPRRKDRVDVCMPQALRLTKCKKLFIVDFNEGVLPVATTDNGLLSDAELIATGNKIEPTARDINSRDRAELMAVVSNADDVFIAYHTAGGAKRAAFVADLAVSMKSIIKDGRKKKSYVEEMATLKESTDARFVAKCACVPPAAREIAARNMSVYADAINAAVAPCENRAKPFAETAKVKRESLSVTELTNWFNCPYKRFLSDSVGLKKRGESSAADYGIVTHEFMERWIAKRPLDASRETVEKIVVEVLDKNDYLTGPSMRAERERVIRDACDFAALNKKVIEAGEYEPQPSLAEKGFGGEIMLGENKDVRFTGRIDRVDYCGGDARIIDYKTGSKSFKLKECLEGLDLQLPLYAATIKDQNDKRVTGAFYLPAGPIYDVEDSALSGFFMRDDGVALDYDRGMKDGTRSKILPARLKLDDKTKEPNGFYRPAASIIEKDEFDAFIDACVETASLAADQINEGYIERTPAAKSCEYCAYRGLCIEKLPRDSGAEEDGEE
ncbi:MAG: PD-(D/E)XK nuclease family protein [Clostridiales bacterium]|nr:PD-(D/E)XK nuclease family protein [Clostridiales bacterium]